MVSWLGPDASTTTLGAARAAGGGAGRGGPAWRSALAGGAAIGIGRAGVATPGVSGAGSPPVRVNAIVIHAATAQRPMASAAAGTSRLLQIEATGPGSSAA